ncbi:MAG: tetratricopeptide repeat protein [Desulfurivibrio sp.]|nr:tetratricopeptide repeat protein [Desulfurivibrio sp.]
MKKEAQYILSIVRLLSLILGLLVAFQPAASGARASELPNAARVVLFKAYEHMQEEEYQQALKVLQDFQSRARTKEPESDQVDPRGYHHPKVYLLRGNIHQTLDNLEQAEEAYRNALKGDPEHLQARVNLAGVSHVQDKFQEAARHFQVAYQLEDKEKPEYLYFAAVSWLQQDSLRESIQGFEQLLKEHPEQIKLKWRENLVHAYLSAERNEQALEHIRILAREHQGDKQIQWQEILLHQYLELELLEEAKDYALELTSQDPVQEKWWKALTHTALARNDYQQAVVALTIYSFLTPLSQNERKLLADLRLQVDVPVQAVPQYKAVLDEAPDKRVLRNLVSAYQQLAEQDQALKTLQEFEKHEQDQELMLLKADLLYQLERFQEAHAAYKQAAGLQGERSGRAWLMAGYAAWETEDLGQAWQALGKAAEFSEQQERAESALEQLARLENREW